MDEIHSRFCQVCSLNDDDPTHNNSPLHRFNFLLYQWTKYRKALVRNRHGVEVAVELQRKNGHNYNYTEYPKKGQHSLKITPANLLLHSNTLNFSCTVKNCQNRSNILLTNTCILHPYVYYSLIDPNNNIHNGKFIELTPGAVYTVIIKFSTDNNVVIGSYKIPISFTFQTVGENVDMFTIARSINISVEETSEEEEKLENSPFKGNNWLPNVEIFPPTKNQYFSNMYEMPPEYVRLIKYGLLEFPGMVAEDYQVLADLKRQIEPGYVTANNYREFWHIILWLEEMGQMLGLQRYNMENVKLSLLDGDLIELVVPGLAEKRPSVIVGDMIDLRVHEDHRGYRGIIKRVNDKTVEIGDIDEEITQILKTTPNIEIDVRFTLSRLCFERMHQAVDQVVQNGMISTCFPDHGLVRKVVSQTRNIRDGEFYNQMIVNNREQKTAVLKILNCTSSHAPYIVFGPPGTGKTVTIVEAILQIKSKTKSKILVCAPANAACDMLTEKLMMHCTKNELIRIMSETVDTSTVHQNVLQYTNYEHDGGYRKVVAEELMKYRIVITTLILVGRYSRKYHPDVVFVDEAAQACEPEVNCALGMINKNKQVVLAGDPRQLGPSLSSRVAEKYGLGKSLLERLMDLQLYQSEDTNFITMLKQNFRSHSTVLRLPNDLFYDNQLQACSPKSENDPLAALFVFNNIQSLYRAGGRKGKNKGKNTYPGQAIEFCSVMSKESRQGRSPSYFNQKEMLMVLSYVQALISLEFDDDEDKVRAEQIGVVTPYIRQVYKVRDILKRNNFEGVEVGTTETFQGREKRVIIISTVRAQKDLLLHDKKYNLGFVKHEKRFNVALTRAMSKLIIIGCPHVLGTDPKWLKFIELSESLHAFCGAPYARRTNEVIDDITRRFRNVKMLDSQHNH